MDDPAAEVLREFWDRAIASGVIDPGTAVPRLVSAFGDSAELADELLALVLGGSKRATCGAIAEYQGSGEDLPSVGDLEVVTDGVGRPRAVLRTTEVRIGPLSTVDDGFAWDEGENDRTRDGWLRAHTAYFTRVLPRLGAEFHPDVEVVFTRFSVVYQEEP